MTSHQSVYCPYHRHHDLSPSHHAASTPQHHSHRRCQMCPNQLLKNSTGFRLDDATERSQQSGDRDHNNNPDTPSTLDLQQAVEDFVSSVDKKNANDDEAATNQQPEDNYESTLPYRLDEEENPYHDGSCITTSYIDQSGHVHSCGRKRGIEDRSMSIGLLSLGTSTSDGVSTIGESLYHYCSTEDADDDLRSIKSIRSTRSSLLPIKALSIEFHNNIHQDRETLQSSVDYEDTNAVNKTTSCRRIRTKKKTVVIQTPPLRFSSDDIDESVSTEPTLQLLRFDPSFEKFHLGSGIDDEDEDPISIECIKEKIRSRSNNDRHLSSSDEDDNQDTSSDYTTTLSTTPSSIHPSTFPHSFSTHSLPISGLKHFSGSSSNNRDHLQVLQSRGLKTIRPRSKTFGGELLPTTPIFRPRLSSVYPSDLCLPPPLSPTGRQQKRLLVSSGKTFNRQLTDMSIDACLSRMVQNYETLN